MAQAQQYPDHPVRVVVGYAAGPISFLRVKVQKRDGERAPAAELRDDNSPSSWG
jgi:tripartite-type tricarboxylate transporter receptor subunit TctC